jgi:hypothetical protein
MSIVYVIDFKQDMPSQLKWLQQKQVQNEVRSIKMMEPCSKLASSGAAEGLS